MHYAHYICAELLPIVGLTVEFRLKCNLGVHNFELDVKHIEVKWIFHKAKLINWYLGEHILEIFLPLKDCYFYTRDAMVFGGCLLATPTAALALFLLAAAVRRHEDVIAAVLMLQQLMWLTLLLGNCCSSVHSHSITLSSFDIGGVACSTQCLLCYRPRLLLNRYNTTYMKQRE